MSKFLVCLAIATVFAGSGCGSSTPESGPGPGPAGEVRSFDGGSGASEVKPLEKPE